MRSDSHLDTLFRSGLAEQAEALAPFAAPDIEMAHRVARVVAHRRARRSAALLIAAAMLLGATAGAIAVGGDVLKLPAIDDPSPSAAPSTQSTSAPSAAECRAVEALAAVGPAVDALVSVLDDDYQLAEAAHLWEAQAQAIDYAMSRLWAVSSPRSKVSSSPLVGLRGWPATADTALWMIRASVTALWEGDTTSVNDETRNLRSTLDEVSAETRRLRLECGGVPALELPTLLTLTGPS